MVTKETTYKIAFQNKKNRLKEKQTQREILLNAAYNANPRLYEIDTQMAQVGAQLALTAISGDLKKLDVLKKQTMTLSAEKTELLKKASVPEIQYECSICSDSGYVSGKICDCIKKESSAVMASELSKEMPLGDCGFENFDLNYYAEQVKNGVSPRRRMLSILNLCRNYVNDFTPDTAKNLLFIGDAGLGKTHLTIAIVKEIVKKGYSPVYGSAENLFSAIEIEKYSFSGRSNYDTILNCDLLVIDDLGAEMVTAFSKSVLYNIINTRILSSKPTIVNTNLTMKQIEERYTPRISSRFIGEYEWNEFLGNDIRQQKLINK